MSAASSTVDAPRSERRASLRLVSYSGRRGVRDPLRGTPSAPSWPDVPVPGSALAKVLQSLAAVRTEIGFDDEGKDGDRVMRSLHARAVFDLG